MSNILFLTMPFWGHINPNIELIKVLSKKHNILLASSLKFKNIFDDLGIPMIEYPETIAEYFGNGVLDTNKDFAQKYYASQYDYDILNKMNSFSYYVLEEVYCTLIEKVEEFNPDIILCDSVAFWGPPFSVKCRKKYICIDSGTNMSDPSQDKYFLDYIERVISKEVGINLNSFEVFDIFSGIEKKQKKFYARFSGCRLKDYYSPEKTYTYMSKDFQIGSEEFIEDIHFLGFDMPVENIRKQDKIFITRGTISDFYNLSILKKIINYIDINPNFKVIATKGNISYMNDDVIDIECKEQIKVKKSVNQIKELSESKLMISHGGITGVREAIMCETPMIIIPSTFHCYQVGLAIEKNHAGIMLKKYPLDRQELNEAINKIISNNYYYESVISLKEKMKREYSLKDICNYIDKLSC